MPVNRKMSQVRYGFSQGKAKPTKKTVVQKQALKAVKKTGTAQTNGVEVAKETENLHKIIILLR
jgi:beta-glucosidase/6-phospho-beta-glucosidase/beta-galactosidase